MVSLADKRDINCIYPAVFYPESGGRFSVIFPDLNGLATCGDSLADAFSMAQDACGQYLFTSLRDGEALPSPTPLNSVEKDDPSAIVNLVYVNLGEYACAYTPSRFGIPIPYKPQHKAQNDPQNNIHNRMLFNEHGGQNDQH